VCRSDGGCRRVTKAPPEDGKLGAILFQFPPWFPISRAHKGYILFCKERVAPRRVCIEFRNRTWMTEGNREETLDFLWAWNLGGLRHRATGS
jgi:uncharacterized protein YecE (DUF72 family)